MRELQKNSKKSIYNVSWHRFSYNKNNSFEDLNKEFERIKI
jgi:hypothetical protein